MICLSEYQQLLIWLKTLHVSVEQHLEKKKKKTKLWNQWNFVDNKTDIMQNVLKMK